MTAAAVQDWAGKLGPNLVAWWIPHAVIVAALLLDTGLRTGVWVAALAWMGTACLINARRCGRLHCRYTGPYYLAAIVPVMLVGSGVVALSLSGWAVLGAAILIGSKVIRVATEAAWGRFGKT